MTTITSLTLCLHLDLGIMARMMFNIQISWTLDWHPLQSKQAQCISLLPASLVHPLRAILLLSAYVISVELAPFISFLGSLLIVIILPLSYRRPYSNSLLVITIILTHLTYLLFSRGTSINPKTLHLNLGSQMLCTYRQTK